MPGMLGRWTPGPLRILETNTPATRLERRVGLGIAVLVPFFAVIGTIVLFSQEGPGSTGRRILCGIVLASTIPVGAWWLRRGIRVARMPGWFVFYADVGVAIVLFTFTSRGFALAVTSLFAVIGTYIAYFSSRRVLRAHAVFVSIVILVLSAATYLEREQDLPAVIAQTLVALLVVNSVIAFRAVIKTQLDLANTDSLTGLLNRRGFDLRLERLLCDCSAGQTVVLAVVDLDRFKNVNDTYGHAAGDRVLKATAERLAAAAPPRACVARTGGEEFTVASVMTPPDALNMAERIRAALARIQNEIPVTGSVGASLISADAWRTLHAGEAAEMVHAALLKADTAMYEAKRSGGNQARVFTG
ncbi:GGDEF domain-containing protein [Rhodococcus sp. BP-252]|uniref:GGDEF domain-containing protein n=1 Tax=unclassified Rhodococcus (in: high G+C Gram-positive bacteria) TaxID=192944 RepID=UPI001C9B8130|nr:MULTISPECIES: GGDEF domain-containing protein [unclassified Rhodococcus (in: high G+C Gram-positive bacteria)]MBY6413263.1 GGDEF domain-containing protein [Rhodococcus sp. BP-320]MBY6419313.1 GGDEF domain-containing protein [Rhodococcus sp. BP-321]MBY6424266.1 GGDEF domain-containing protein [Rhodococcus sp. BP-324]MBY6428006.1 GGDEF domain-containing protein [Rhodococcus sp. BP-323]MBY6433184.1 GGDEF domain-containing protein [Rhodococcus sp. BP-322]